MGLANSSQGGHQRSEPASGQALSAAQRSKYGLIPDNFSSIQQVQEKLREVGLESSNLIVGVDFTASNTSAGRKSFQGRCLHALGPQRNPYETAIAVIGETLSAFDEDDLIPCYGFGDASTGDNAVFSFYPEDRPCSGFEDVQQRYRAIVPHIDLSGPTSFAPIIKEAVRKVEQSGGQYHVLLIIADGQVSQTKPTVDAICEASNYPLSIVLVGVGDGPWEMMEYFDDSLPQRKFDNFQFVNFTKTMSGPGTLQQLAARFSLMALMEVPFQYQACVDMNLVGNRAGCMPPQAPQPPPLRVRHSDAKC